MTALAFPLRNTLRLDRWRRPQEIGWVSEGGLVKQEGSFTFADAPQGVRIGLRIAYEPPASVIGEPVAHRPDGTVRPQLAPALPPLPNKPKAHNCLHHTHTRRSPN